MSQAQLAVDSFGVAKTHAQVSTQPGDGDQGSAIRKYFGPPTNLHYYTRDALSADRRQGPHAYIGENVHLRDIVDGSIFGNKDSWYTTLALPFVRHDNPNFTWSVWTFDQNIVGAVPNEGPVRLVKSRESSHAAKTVRRGIGFTVEHDFWRTERGQRNYYYNILQIRASVQLTCNYDVITAILSSDEENRKISSMNGFTKLDIRSLAADEVTRFGACQKNPRDMDIIIDTMTDRLERLSVQPTLLITPPQMRKYLSLVSDFHTSFDQRGETAVQTFDQGRSSRNVLRLKSMPQVTPVTTNTFFVSDNQDEPLDPLARERDVGAYFLMNANKYDPSATRDVMVYDEETDQMVRISIEEAIENCGRFGPSGELNQFHDGLVDRGDPRKTRDMFISVNETGQLEIAQKWVNVNTDYLDARNIDAVVESVAKILGKNPLDQPSVDDSIRISAMFGLKVRTGPTGTRPTRSASISAPAPTTSRGAAELNTEVKTMLTSAGLPTVSYDNAVMFTNDRDTFVEKMHEWVTNNQNDLSKFSETFNKLKKFKHNSTRTQAKLDEFQTVLQELGITGITVTTDAVSNTLEFKEPEIVQHETLTTEYSGPLSKDPSVVSLLFDHDNVPENSQPSTASQRTTTNRPWSTKRTLVNEMRDVVSGRTPSIGTLAPTSMNSYGVNGRSIANNNQQGAYIDTLVSGTIRKTIAIDFLRTPITKHHLLTMARNGVYIPINFMCARPFIRHNMLSAVLMRGGTETGATFVGPSNMLLSDDGAAKKHFGNYTFQHKAIVTTPKNIVIAEDVMFNGYRGGNNTRFFNLEEIRSLTSSTGRNRLHSDRNRPSIICMALPVTEDKFNHIPLDLRGFYNNDSRELRDQHYSTAQFYALAYNLDGSIRTGAFGRDFRSVQDGRIGINLLCFPDHYVYWKDGGFNGVKTCRGHLGPNLYPGVRHVFDGKTIQIDPQHYRDTI